MHLRAKHHAYLCLVLICLTILILPVHVIADPSAPPLIEIWKAGYRSGDPAAAYRLGSAYQFGRHGAWMNLAEAVRWYRLGARRGDFQSAMALADMYLAGEGTPQSEEKAVYWYLKLGASASEYARPARTRLLMLTKNYAFGENGVRQDPVRARDLFKMILKMEQDGQANILQEPESQMRNVSMRPAQ